MHILLKYPTRGRAKQFLKTLAGWINAAHDPDQISVLVSYDIDDFTMAAPVLREARQLHSSVFAIQGPNRSKIDACNADLDILPITWDVVLLISDDMFCSQVGWDWVIRNTMQTHFPNTDGALWFYDGVQRSINTIECVGRKRYERFGYLYHPSYKSFFCDNESTAIGTAEGKLLFVEKPICKHEHPAWRGCMSYDSIYAKNQLWMSRDHANFNERKDLGFPR